MQQTTFSRPNVKGFYESRTGSIQYVVSDPTTRRCAIIDPVLDFDEKSGMTTTCSADTVLDYVRENDLTIEWIFDTHPHADHFSAAGYLAEKTGVPTGIGEQVVWIQALWKQIYNLPALPADGSQWNRLFKDRERFRIGQVDAEVIYSPGHTPASITFLIGDAAFIHDTIFMPDSGTARADFPGGNPSALWRSIQTILSLPDETRLFTGHDYRAEGREARWESTVAEQRRSNSHLANTNEAGFVALRNARDNAADAGPDAACAAGEHRGRSPA